MTQKLAITVWMLQRERERERGIRGKKIGIFFSSAISFCVLSWRSKNGEKKKELNFLKSCCMKMKELDKIVDNFSFHLLQMEKGKHMNK